MKARDRIRHSIYRSHRVTTQMDLLNSRRLKASQLAWAGYAADSLIAEGYRKPDILGYVVLSRDGAVVKSFGIGQRPAAQAFADEQTQDCAALNIDWDYRVAEIAEIAEARP